MSKLTYEGVHYPANREGFGRLILRANSEESNGRVLIACLPLDDGKTIGAIFRRVSKQSREASLMGD